jgi:hypothetical protein
MTDKEREALTQREREALTVALVDCIDTELERTGAREAERGETVSSDLTHKAAFRAGRRFEAALAAHEESRQEADWNRVRRMLDEAIADVAPLNVKKVRSVAGALRSWAESSEHRDGELSIEAAEFVVDMADDLLSAAVREAKEPSVDTERPGAVRVGQSRIGF